MSCNCGQRIVNATSAAVRVVTAVVASKQVKVDSATKAARLAICLACPEMEASADKTAHKCKACGCWLDGNALCKACLATENCPKDLWPKL